MSASRSSLDGRSSCLISHVVCYVGVNMPDSAFAMVAALFIVSLSGALFPFPPYAAASLILLSLPDSTRLS